MTKNKDKRSGGEADHKTKSEPPARPKRTGWFDRAPSRQEYSGPGRQEKTRREYIEESGRGRQAGRVV